MNASNAISRALIQPPVQLWKSYLHHLEKSPRATKAATSVIAAILGDSLAQHISNRQKPTWDYDWARTARLALFNAGMGVVGHEYYKRLDGGVMPHASKSPRAIATKLVIDQFMFAPICTAVFYYYKVVMEGRRSDYVKEVQEKYIPTLLAGYKLWIPAHIINFALVPNRQRILYANVVSIFGTYILSRAQAGDYTQPAATEEQRALRRRGGEVVGLDTVMLKDD